MRRAVTPAIPPSAYRHFAVITLALTMGLAMFAEGENREAQAVQVVQPQPPQPEAPATFATPAPSARSSRTPSGWNDDSDTGGHFGRPMENLLSSGNSSVIPEEVTESLSPDDQAALSKAERELLLRGVRDSIRPAPPARN